MSNKSFEYQVLEAQSLVTAEQLNDLAKQGWRLIEIVLVDYRYYFYFEGEIIHAQ